MKKTTTRTHGAKAPLVKVGEAIGSTLGRIVAKADMAKNALINEEKRVAAKARTQTKARSTRKPRTRRRTRNANRARSARRTRRS